MNEIQRYGVIDICHANSSKRTSNAKRWQARRSSPSTPSRQTRTKTLKLSQKCTADCVQGRSEESRRLTLRRSKQSACFFFTVYESTFVQHGQEPESETVRHQKRILQRPSNKVASVHRNLGGHGPLDSDRYFAQANVRDPRCRSQLTDVIRFVLD